MKKIIILTSAGGGGHISVSSALTSYLKDMYEVEEAFPFKHILASLDPFMSSILGNIDGEEIYNYVLRKKQYALANLLYKVGTFYFSLRSRRIQLILERYFKNKKPDLVISVIPIINQQVFLATKKLAIPFLLIPTDLDPTTFLHKLTGADHPLFKLSLAFDDDDMRKVAEIKGINPSDISINGFPLRPDFFTKKNKNLTREQFGIPDNKPCIMILMGTQGSNEMLHLAKELSKLDMPTHLICCIGKNEKIGALLQTLRMPNHISLSIIGFTPYVSDLMSIADLIITKSGSVSVCETIYSNTPTLLDATSTILRWEQFNHYFFKKHKIGEILSADSPIAMQVKAVFGNQKLLNEFKKNLRSYDKKRPVADIPHLIEHMIASKHNKEKGASSQPAYTQLSLSSALKHK